MRKAPKKMEYEEAPDDVKEHRWKMKNDPEYVAARKRSLMTSQNSLESSR